MLAPALDAWYAQGQVPAFDELRAMTARLPAMAEDARASWRERDQTLPDYLGLVDAHNPRRGR
jgi:hypothetical protein